MNAATANGITPLQAVQGQLAGLRLLLLISSILLSSCGGKFIYGVDMLNHGTEGIIVLGMTGYEPYVRKPFKVTMASGEEAWANDYLDPGLTDLSFVIAMDPTIPSKFHDNTAGIGRFRAPVGKDGKLPDEVEIVWQVAELKDCEEELWANQPSTYAPNANANQRRQIDESRTELLNEIREMGLDPAKSVNKWHCTYVPQPDSIYRKKLDMDAIRNSEAYQKTGKKDPDGSGYYTLNIELVFIEDQLRVTTSNGATNPWR